MSCKQSGNTKQSNLAFSCWDGAGDLAPEAGVRCRVDTSQIRDPGGDRRDASAREVVVLVYRGDQRTGTVVRSFVGLLDTPGLSCGLLRGRLGDFCFRAGSFFRTAGA